LNHPQGVEFEYRHAVAAAVTGKSTSQCRRERNAVNARGIGNAPRQFAAHRFDHVDAITPADEQPCAARLQSQEIPTAAAAQGKTSGYGIDRRGKRRCIGRPGSSGNYRRQRIKDKHQIAQHVSPVQLTGYQFTRNAQEKNRTAVRM